MHHIEALCIYQELERFQRQFFECCIIVSALSSGFVYFLQGEAVTTAQNINDSLFLSIAGHCMQAKSKPLGFRLVSNIHFCLSKQVLKSRLFVYPFRKLYQ